MTDTITLARPDGSVIEAAPGQIAGVFMTSENVVSVYVIGHLAPFVCRHATLDDALTEVEAIAAAFAGGRNGN